MSRRAAGLVLAAGLGTRFGETPKLIAPLGDKPILQHVLDTLHENGVAPVVVVLGHAMAEVRAAIKWRDEIQVENKHAARGLLRSVLLGLRALDQTWSLPDRTVIVLGDQPLLRRDQIDAVLSVAVDEERPFVVSRYSDGHSGNPVVLEATGRYLVGEFVKRMRAADRGLSQFFHAFPDRVRYVDIPGANPDIDTPADLARAVVEQGYDALGADYLAWSQRVTDPAREAFVADLESRLADGAAVLELGCGPGVLTTRRLAERFAVTGVDSSEAQIELARQNVPTGRLVHGDMTRVEFAVGSFDAVVALYSISHVPRNEQAPLLKRIAGWLPPSGWLLVTLSAVDTADWTGEWIGGQQMFFSGFDADSNRQMLADAGFDTVRDKIVEISEPEGPARFLWVLCRRTP